MSLSPSQLSALKADILADPALANQPMTSAGALAIADAYAVVGLVNVWRTDAPVFGIIDAINWVNYTPNDAADNTATYTNRALLAQTKQMNLQIMLQGRQAIDASKATIRAGLRDAVIQLPTGAGGALTSPGGASGANVLAACTRKANRGEALFATTQATTGSTSAYIMTFEGLLTSDDVQQARELP